jgi:hypothetical protein
MRTFLASALRVLLVGAALTGGTAGAAAATQQPAAPDDVPAADTTPAGSAAQPAKEPGIDTRRDISQELRVTTVVWPGAVHPDVDPFWAEVEYRPRATAARSRFSGTAELLFRATVSGFATAPDGNDGDLGRHSLRVQRDRQSVLVKQLSVSIDAPVDVEVGWQILSWGHATDLIRVLDVFQRQDLTDRLRPEALGIPAVSASLGNDEWEAEAVWVPGGATDRIATTVSNIWYAFPRGAPFGGLEVTDDLGFSLSNGEAGVRITRYGQNRDLAVIVARTRDRAPSAVEFSQTAATSALHARSLFKPYWLIGASVVQTAGSYLLRAEALHATYSDREDTPVDNGIRGVVGVERRITRTGSRYTLIAQYTIDTTASEQILQQGFYLASPYRVYRHALTGSGAAAWRQQYELEARALWELLGGSSVASAKFSYRHNDRLTLWIAADRVSGGSGTWLEPLDSADRLLTGITVRP